MRSVDDEIQRYETAKNLRSAFETDWRTAAAYCIPTQYGPWQSSGINVMAQFFSPRDARRRALDTRAMRALPKWVSVVEQLSTPHQQMYHKLEATSADLMKVKRVREWFQLTTRVLFRERYKPTSRFIVANSELNISRGVYGNGLRRIAKKKVTAHSPGRGLIHQCFPLRNCFWLTDGEGNVDTFFIRVFVTARMFKQMFPKEKPPRSIANELQRPAPSETTRFELVNVVHPNDDYQEFSLGRNGKAWVERWIAVQDREEIGEPVGDATCPYIPSRLNTDAEAPYGWGPAHLSLSAMGVLSAMKRTALVTGQKIADPVLLAHDDGAIRHGMDRTPGSVVYGGLGPKGEELVKGMTPGSLAGIDKLMAMEGTDIDDAFFVNLFTLLQQSPQKTATEVMDDIAQRAAIAAPTVNRLWVEDLYPTTNRELDLLAQLDMLPQMPGELIEAKGEYEIIDTSPFARAQRMASAAGFNRLVMMAADVAKATGDSAPLRRFDFDEAIVELSWANDVPENWLKDDDAVKADVAAQSQQQQVDQLSQAAPAIAGMIKASGGINASSPSKAA